jgi:glycosyl transferase family 25
VTLPIFVINLPHSTERLTDITEHLRGLNLEFQRVEAVNGHSAEASTLGEYDNHAMHRIMGRSLTPGEFGCVLSHRKALAAFLAGSEPWAVVLEDDAQVASSFPTLLPSVAHWLCQHRPNWRVVNIGHPVVKIYTALTSFQIAGNTHRLLAAHYFPMGAFALLWSRRGAEELLMRGSRVELPYDNSLQHWLCRDGEGYALSPAVVGVKSGQSDIDSIDGSPEHGISPTRTERDLLYGVKKFRRLWINRLAAISRQQSLRREIKGRNGASL